MPSKTMRQQARKAGHLNSNEQEKVTTQGNTIVIEPANPDVVYVPAYDPWLVYGDPIVAYPGWYPVPGIFYGGPGTLLRCWIWNRLLRRIWVGLASLGTGTGTSPQDDLQPQHLYLPQPNDH